MSTSIDWADALGGASLTNGNPFPSGRFTNWNPRSIPWADSENALGDGALHVFEYREDHSVSFDLVGIPYSSLGLMLRLQNHLESGGAVQITTGDSLDSVYPLCSLMPDTEVEIRLTDKKLLRYTMSMTLLNVDSPRVPMIAVY